MTLVDRWQTEWREVGASRVDEELYARLVESYSEPHRRYHTIQHLEECFAHLDLARSIAQHASEVELALWFHDAIYDTRRTDNEERSAEWARAAALASGLPIETAERIAGLVLATKHDAVPVGTDAGLLVDIDLAILGSETARFEEYEVQIREECAWVPESLYQNARRKILQGFVSREQIYSTELFHAAYEIRARENINRSLARLNT